ncbi:MAG: hypothetical protein M1833_001921, partial [Piccolia ochrophora]
MATTAQHLEGDNKTRSPRSSDDAFPSDKKDHSDQDVANLKFPEPWKYEKFLPGGYGQSWMLKFKSPARMYKAINLFAGIAILFYGYDQ